MEIKKNKNSFLISKNEKYSVDFFKNYENWEPDTIHVLEYYKNYKKGVYIDIGAWIGPTVLYAANIYEKIIAIEPDPIALYRLKTNLSVNNFNNIVIIEKGLSSENGITELGGNGKLGNSQSTMLIANKEDFLSYDGHHKKHKNHNHIVKIETITIEKIIEEQNVDPEHISLIKMDIEGGEKIVIPGLVNFLNKHKPFFYISLHWQFLREIEVIKILDILFDIYDKCYTFSDNGEKNLIEKNFIIEKKISCGIVFE